MTVNPYEAPSPITNEIRILSTARDDLRTLARAQKGTLLSLLAFYTMYFGFILGHFMLPLQAAPVVVICIVVLWIVVAIFASWLGIRVYGSRLGILPGLATIIPLIGLLILLSLSGRATKMMRANGIHVGLMGADTSQI